MKSVLQIIKPVSFIMSKFAFVKNALGQWP